MAASGTKSLRCMAIGLMVTQASLCDFAKMIITSELTLDQSIYRVTEIGFAH
jgi:hypothetical protein